MKKDWDIFQVWKYIVLVFLWIRDRLKIDICLKKMNSYYTFQWVFQSMYIYFLLYTTQYTIQFDIIFEFISHVIQQWFLLSNIPLSKSTKNTNSYKNQSRNIYLYNKKKKWIQNHKPQYNFIFQRIIRNNVRRNPRFVSQYSLFLTAILKILLFFSRTYHILRQI